MPENNTVTIYLASWQKRMARDFIGKRIASAALAKKFEKVEVAFTKGQCLASYKLPAMGMRRDDWILYLTDEQMTILQRKFDLRTPVASIDISPANIESGAVRFG